MKAAFNFSIVLVCINYKHIESPLLLISHPAVRGVLICGMCIGRTSAVSVQLSWTPPLKFYNYSMCGMHPCHATCAFSLAGFPYIWDTFTLYKNLSFLFFVGETFKYLALKLVALECDWTHIYLYRSHQYILVMRGKGVGAWRVRVRNQVVWEAVQGWFVGKRIRMHWESELETQFRGPCVSLDTWIKIVFSNYILRDTSPRRICWKIGLRWENYMLSSFPEKPRLSRWGQRFVSPWLIGSGWQSDACIC